MLSPVVCNSSPLIGLQHIGRLDLLESLFGEIKIPPAVVAEVEATVVLPFWIEAVSPVESIGPLLLKASLGPGESESIALALEISARLVILNDRPVRRLAQTLKVPVIGTLGILRAAKRKFLIPAVKPCLDSLLSFNFRVAPALYKRLLEDADEALDSRFTIPACNPTNLTFCARPRSSLSALNSRGALHRASCLSMRKLLFSLALLPALSLCAQAQAPRPILSTGNGAGYFATPAKTGSQVQKQTLPNGLTVLARENHGAPVVAVRVYVRTGSIYEDKYLGAGLSHLFEHTLFEGTKTRDKKALNDELQAIGGQSNAYTSYDVTAYHVTTAAPYFDRAAAILADMVRNATFPEAEVKVQQGVIHNEMNLGEDNPQRALSELFDQTAFRVHPVRYPIIGYPAQFDALSRQDVLDYYKTHYTPENTVVSVAGDVDAAQIFETIKKEFGDWPRGIARTPILPTEPAQNAPRRATAQMPVNLTYLEMGWHTIPLQNPDLYALDTLAQILGGGDSSRLQRQLLQRDNLVNDISAFSGTPNYDAGIFGISATLPPENLAKVESAVKNQVALIKKSGVTPAELERAKRQIKTSFIFGSQGVENQAEQAAYDELGTGDPNYSKRYVERIQAVSAAQVQAMALKYLKDDGLTTAVVEPKVEVKPIAAAAMKMDAALAPATLTTLPNGVRLIVRPNAATPTVSMVAMGLGGVRLEPKTQAGIAGLTSQLLTRGTAKRDAEQISDLVDDLGGSLDGFSGYNAWGISGQFLASDWKRGLNLMAESILTPTFPADELAKLKSQTASALAAQDDDPMNAAALLVRQLYFGEHPYGRSTLGTPAALKGIDRADVVNFWKRELQPKDLVIAVYGDIKPAEVQNLTTYLLGTFKAQGAPLAAPMPMPAPAKMIERDVQKPGVTQTALWYGFPAVDVKNEDRYALDVLDAALSGANLPGGRLHERLRNAELVYVVHAYDAPGLDPGNFIVYAATTKENEPKARAIIDEEIGKVRDQPIAPIELERAKTMMISSHAIDDQTNADQAQSAAADELYGLGFRNDADYAARINAITLADVQRVARKYLDPNHSALAIVGPQ